MVEREFGQSSLRDGIVSVAIEPGVETPGYHPSVATRRRQHGLTNQIQSGKPDGVLSGKTRRVCKVSAHTVTAKDAYSLLAQPSPPRGLRVSGELDFSPKSKYALLQKLPDDLHVDVLNLSECQLESLPAALSAYELILTGTPIRTLPEDLSVRMRLDLTRCDRLESLPNGLTVGSLTLRGCNSLRALPEGLDVWFLDLSGCWAFEQWPQVAQIRSGHLQLRGCTAVRELPSYLKVLSALNVCDCPNLQRLPDELVVSGWLDLGRSGLTEESALPVGLSRTQLRWAGVAIDRRIAFHPELMTVDELLTERNAERRRALLDRYGYGRFLLDAHAEILNRDHDPGGERQLLRVKLPDDEDLVALSCFCPSTSRQYIIRVPPTTTTCHQAAAWIAGFDNPDDYQPLVET